MNFGPLGNPITPVMTGVQTLAAKWPAITSLAIVNYVGEMAVQAAPAPYGPVNTILFEGVRAAYDIVKFATWDASRGM